jgi:hypothetical protein
VAPVNWLLWHLKIHATLFSAVFTFHYATPRISREFRALPLVRAILEGKLQRAFREKSGPKGKIVRVAEQAVNKLTDMNCDRGECLKDPPEWVCRVSPIHFAGV